MAIVADTIPTRQGLPLLGSLFDYNHNRIDFYMESFRQYGERCRFYLGPRPVLLLSAASDVRNVLVEDAHAFGISWIVKKAFHPLAANGLLTSEGDVYRRQRKLIAPTFQPRHITNYAAIMCSYGEQIQRTWADGSIIDVNREMTNLTMSIIVKVLFDADVHSETDVLGDAMKTALEQINRALTAPLPFLIGWVPPHTRQALHFLKSKMQHMISERRQNASGKEDLLSLLLRARDEADGKGMSDEQLMDEMLTLFFAGHETLAAALSWTWYLLATHPDIYQKMLQEVDTVLQDRAPTNADLAHLPYTLQIFKESLRLYPPVHSIVRVVQHDIQAGTLPLRKGETLLISPYVLHHREDYFSFPETFHPERFTPENEKRLPRYAYLPFGAGPRLCIGNHFALMEGPLLLATLARRVTFELVPGQKVIPLPKVILHPNAVKVRVCQRR